MHVTPQQQRISGTTAGPPSASWPKHRAGACRLAAKKAVLQALTAIGAEIGKFECPKCAQEAADLDSLSEDERVLRRLDMTVEKLSGMSLSEFDTWQRERRAGVEEALAAARRVRQEGGS